MAAQENHIDTVNLLLENGANPHIAAKVCARYFCKSCMWLASLLPKVYNLKHYAACSRSSDR